MINYNIGYYLDKYDTLLPADEDITAIVNSLWYQYIKGKFDDEVWANFYDRELFDNRKFNNDNEQLNYDNIIKTIKIRLINKQRIYERMFNAFIADFNPLWNVDGVTGTIRESTHTGTDTDAHTGTENNTTSDSGTVTNTGKTDTTNTGKNSTTRTGNETNTPTGIEVNSESVTTYDSATHKDTVKNESSYTGRVDTHAYNNVKDEYYIDNANPLKQSYEIDGLNPLRETRNLSGSNNKTFNTQLQKTLNLKDNDLEMIIRQGNIGVTRSDELIQHALELFDSQLYDFVRYVTNDLISQVTYSIY